MAEEEDYSALPLEQRLTHKTWKVRMNAYNELTTMLKQMDPDNEAAQFNVYENYLSKIVLDTNMAAQEAGISTVIAFVENAPNPTRRREEIVGGIVSKCLSATKAGTRTQSVELLLLLSEVDTPGPVVTGVIEGFDAKQPKAVAAAVAAVKDIVSAFGVKFLTLKPLLKALLKPFAHKDNSVRTEAQRLAVELYRWMGQAIMPSLQDLPSVLHKELEAQFAAISGNPPPKQTRLLRSQQEEEPSDEPAASNAGASSDNADDGVESAGSAAAEIDPWDMVDPVDITKKLPDDYYTFVVSSKWKERKEVIESLHGSLKKSIRLQMSPGTGDIIQEMGKKIADTNIIVATLAIQCLGLFASGLRQAFSPFVQSTLPALIEKSKERKQTVVDAIRETEDAYFLATGCDLASISDHYFTGASHKNPQTRAEANHMLRRCLAVVPTRPGKGDVKRYVDQLKSGLDDGDAGVRESAAECLGTLSKLVTAKVIEPFIESVDKIKLEKIHEYAEKATVKAKAPVAAKPKAPAAGAGARGSRPPPPRSKPAAKAPAAPSAAAPVSASNGDDGADGESGLSANLPPHIRKKLEASARAAAIKKAQREGKPIDDLLPPPPQPAAKPTPAARPSAPSGPPKRPAAAPAARKPAAAPKPGAKAKPGAGTSASGGNKNEAIKMRFANDESLDDKIASAIPEAILSGFSSTKWKERMEAMDQLKEHLSNQAAGGTGVHPELVVRQLSRKPGWKESNFQVSQRAFQLIEWMANEEDLEFNTGAAALCAPTLVDKLGDIKLKGPASNALVAIAQRFTLRFVVGLVIEPIRGQKSPKVLADCLAWLDTQMLEFGTKGLSLRPVVEMVKEVGLQSSNAQTRTKAVAFMGTLRRAIGPAVMDLMGDLNPQLLQLVEAEFERVGSQPMPEPIHTQRGLSGENGAAAAGSGSASGSGALAGEDPMDDLFPRQDLSALIGQNIYKKLGDNNWKERKAALDEIQSALDGANHRILPNISADLYTALKHRLQDPNKNLITVALGLLGALSADSGAAQIPNIRIVALATIHCLADKKPQLRAAALAAMMAWAEATPLCVDQAILPAIPNALGDSSPELRSSLLQWTADVLGPRNAKGIRLPDLSLLITPLFACLQDRNLEVRKQATRVLELTVISCGFETVLDACSMQLHGAAKNAVSPLIEDFRHSIGGEGSPAARRTVGMSAPGRGRPGGPAAAIERAASPAVEPVMTASELLGRAPAAAPTSATGAALQGRPMSMTAAAASSPKAASSAQAASSGGPGMLRRPLAVRRPAGPPGAPAAGARPARAMRGPMSAAGSAEVSRPGSSMRVGTPALQSQASQMARMSNEELESIPPILDCDFRSKDQRARRDMASNPNGVPRWAQLGDSRVRADLENQLCEQAAAHLNPLIQRQLFSTGHYKDRDYLTGLTTIEEVVSIPALSQQRFNLPLFSPSPDMDSLAARFMANIDILLKYISLRMYEGSTHTLLKSFDLLERLIHLTEENQNQQQQQQGQANWSDYEVQAILPALVSRLGDAKEVVRSRSRRILTQLVTHLYPMTKLFTVLLEHGVTNRNNARIRQESLESVCFLIRERTAGCGLSAVCAQPSRAVPIIAQGIADRDSNVRTATLNVLVAVGEQLPGGAEDLWRLCGRIGEKERTMLEEKIKRSSIATDTAASAGAARPGSRIGMIPNASVAAARSRMGSSIARPSSQASGAIGGIPRNGPQGSGIAAGMGAGLAGASRLARPAAPPAASVPSYGAADSNHASEYSTGHSYASSSRPMFSLDFDKLNLPSYSSSTMENLKNPSFTRGSSLRPPAGAPSRPQASEVANTAIGYGAGRKESLQGALNGMHLGMAGGTRAQEQYGAMQQMSGSPVMNSPGRPMSISAYNNTLSASDFPSMSEPEREEWMQGIIADLSGDDPKASEKAIDRFASLLETVPRPSDREKMDPQLYISQAGPAHYHIRKNLDSLVSAIAMQIRWAYTTTSTDLSMQSPFQSTLNLIRRSALEVLIQVFGNIYFAMWIRLDAVQTLIEELVYRAVDPMLKPSRSASGARVGNSAIPDSLGLSKAVNSILVRIIDYADRTTVYVALIRLFESAMAEPAPNPPQTDNDIMRMEFGDMVQKCLWRLTKVLPDDLKRQFGRYVDQDSVVELPREVVDPEFGNPLVHPAIRVHHILRMTHRFFVRVPDREWRKRSDKDAWMFGDLPRRTVKTIHHTIISYLGIYSWQFCGLIIRDVMEADNTLIRPAPSMASNVNDPATIQWAQDTHGKLVRASETWGYVHTCLEADEYNGGVPTVAQLLVAMNVALNSPSSEVGDDLSDEDSDVVMNSVPTSNYHIQQQQQQQQLFNQPASRGSYAGSAASVSPYQQPRQVGYSSQMQTTANNFSAARAQSPGAYSSSSRIGSMPHSYQPPAPAMARVSSPQPTGLPPMAPTGASGEYRSTQERFNALRARILNSQSILPQAQHPTSVPAPSSPISTGSASSAIPGRRLAAVDMSSTGIQPPEVPRTMEDIGARIARMRNSLRSNSTSKQ